MCGPRRVCAADRIIIPVALHLLKPTSGQKAFGMTKYCPAASFSTGTRKLVSGILTHETASSSNNVYLVWPNSRFAAALGLISDGVFNPEGWNAHNILVCAICHRLPRSYRWRMCCGAAFCQPHNNSLLLCAPTRSWYLDTRGRDVRF